MRRARPVGSTPSSGGETGAYSVAGRGRGETPTQTTVGRPPMGFPTCPSCGFDLPDEPCPRCKRCGFKVSCSLE